jgi:hypothetical protein
MSTENEPDCEIETRDTEPPTLAEDTVPSSRLPDGGPLPEISVIPRSVLENINGRLAGIESRLESHMSQRPAWLDEVLVVVQDCANSMVAVVSRIEVLEDFQRKRRYSCRDCPRWTEVSGDEHVGIEVAE